MIGLAEKIAALPEWNEVPGTGYHADKQRATMNYHAALARLALAREALEEKLLHTGGCEKWRMDPIDPSDCTCGRDALLAALEPPK